jgi:hypothetical protein
MESAICWLYAVVAAGLAERKFLRGAGGDLDVEISNGAVLLELGWDYVGFLLLLLGVLLVL